MPQTDAAASWPNYCEDDFVIEDYRFASGELMPELRLHYRTMGVPRRNAAGKIVNGVLLLQGNTGTGANWLRPSLADELYGPAQPLDARQYFLIMQDAIGRGGSSKPSDGLRGNFPHYRYRDMIESGYRLVTEHLGVGHLRLVIGSSMGGRDQRPQLARPPRRRQSDPQRSGLERRLLRQAAAALHLQRGGQLQHREPDPHPGDGSELGRRRRVV